MTVCVISQPRFFPGLHYLHRMMIADIFVIFDTVQFTPRHEENRTRIKTDQGIQWLTAPVRQSNRAQRIVDTQVDDNQPWRRKAIRTLEHVYGRAPHYHRCAPEITGTLGGLQQTLTQLDYASWEPALARLNVTCRFVHASTLPVEGKGPELLQRICAHLGADTYLSGAFGREYLHADEFAAAGIAVRFHEYTYPAYPQLFGEFVPWLSYLDLLFNADLDRERVASGGRMVSA